MGEESAGNGGQWEALDYFGKGLTEQLVLWLRNTTQCNEYGQNSVVETKHNSRGLNYA